MSLDKKGVAYCHWKSNAALHRSARGDNDLDLLVRRADATRFCEVLFRLGFRQAQAPTEKWMPGVLDFYGYENEIDKIIHVHAHFQLIAGHDMTKNYCLPIEDAFLDSSIQNGVFKVPAPEFEFIVFVIRMALKHLTWDATLLGRGGLTASEQHELEHLQSCVDKDLVVALLYEHLPCLSIELFDRCLLAIKRQCSLHNRLMVGHQLERALGAYARRISSHDTYLRLVRQIKWGLQRRLLNRVPRRRLICGGAMIAIIGGDGAGKTTAVDGLYSWLSKDFEVMKVHLGKPPWSLTTTIVRATLSLGRRLGLYPHHNSSLLYMHKPKSSEIAGKYPWMLREVCKARDRYLIYAKARRFAANGGLVITDRFPIPQLALMDCAAIEQVIGREKANRLSRYLIAQEQKFYLRIVWPELLIVLKLDPEIAVARKTDEKASEVRIRSNEIWEIDWQRTQARVVDANHSRTEVLTTLKSMVWTAI